MQIPVTVRGKDAAGRGFFGRTEAILIDDHGARLRSNFSLSVKAQIELHVPEEKKWRKLQVIWIGTSGSIEDGMAGLEFVDPKESWDLEGLRARWGGGSF